MKENLNINYNTLFTVYTSNIVRKTNQFKHNNLCINLFCLQYHSYICNEELLKLW